VKREEGGEKSERRKGEEDGPVANLAGVSVLRPERAMESIMDANRFSQMVLGSPAPVMNWWSRATCSSVAV
jgi:hypothetical protein